LKGYTNEQRKNFFTGQFSSSPKFYANMQAVHGWIAMLQSKPEDNVTISWIRFMLDEERNKRIGISNLADAIFSYQAEHVYYGACCANDDDSDGSSHGNSPVEAVTRSSWSNDTLYRLPTRDQRTEPAVSSLIGDPPTPVTIEPAAETTQPTSLLSVGLGTAEHHSSATFPGPDKQPHSIPNQWTPNVSVPQQAQTSLPTAHGGGYNPGDGPSEAVSAVDQLLPPRRVQSELGFVRPGPLSNRVDALWQEAYLIHESEARYGEAGSTLTSAMPYARQYYQQNSDGQPPTRQSQSLHSNHRTQRPSWNDVLRFTGISVFRPV
jgi:hypothetical protein